MRDAPCGRPDCPIIEPGEIDRRALRIHRLAAGGEWFRAARHEFANTAFTPEGVGNGRFSPLVGHGHTYLAEQRSATLLESVLHETAGPNPRIYRAQLARFRLCRVRLTRSVRLVDLRDDALDEMAVDRTQLTGADALHYACTRLVADRLVGSKASAGFVWTSRQGSLHAQRNPDGLASEVLHHQRLDAAVLYQPEATGAVEVIGTEELIVDGTPIRFVLELANLLRIAVL